MISYDALIEKWQGSELQPWADVLASQIAMDFHERRYGDLPRWLDAMQQLPQVLPDHIALDKPRVSVGQRNDLSNNEFEQLEQALRGLHPWRKGPFELFGLHIDTEWRSDFKWSRLENAIAPLQGKTVLDVGCGSGYHCWRMLGAGASQVIGIDPTPLFVVQFWALQRYIQNPNAWVLPLGIEHLPEELAAFDTVFSMGILYHRRSPIDHLQALKDALKPDGELVLETLVIEGGPTDCLTPVGRYARMGNVWFIPSVAMLTLWLEKLGFRKVKLVDVTRTTTEEQRSTEWMTFQSLADFLHPDDDSRSIEGYPAPTRALLTASK